MLTHSSTDGFQPNLFGNDLLHQPSAVFSVGDFLTVPDPLPDPAPGQGRYYVTAVNYMGQRRYGRKAINGVLSGRDPAVLPACSR